MPFIWRHTVNRIGKNQLLRTLTRHEIDRFTPSGLSRSELKARTGDNKPKKKSQSGSQPLQAQRECSLPALENSSSSSGGFTLDERARAILESDSSFSSQVGCNVCYT